MKQKSEPETIKLGTPASDQAHTCVVEYYGLQLKLTTQCFSGILIQIGDGRMVLNPIAPNACIITTNGDLSEHELRQAEIMRKTSAWC